MSNKASFLAGFIAGLVVSKYPKERILPSNKWHYLREALVENLMDHGEDPLSLADLADCRRHFYLKGVKILEGP